MVEVLIYWLSLKFIAESTQLCERGYFAHKDLIKKTSYNCVFADQSWLGSKKLRNMIR